MPACIGEKAAQLVPHVLRTRGAEVDAEPLAELVDDLDVVARLAGRVERLAHALHAPLGARDRALGLGPARRRGQHDVRELCGLREEDVLHDEMVEPFEQLDRMLLVGLRLRRVLADHVQRTQVAALHRVEHLREVLAALRRDLGAPLLLEARAGRVVLDVLEAGQLVRERAHVTAALHVVLAAQGRKARAVASDVPRQQREVDQRKDVVDRVVVLGDPERPAELRAVGARVRVRELADRVGRNAGDALGLHERPRLDRRAVLLVAGRRARDELLVHEPGRDDLATHGVRERDVRADVDAEPEVGPLRGTRCGADRSRSASRRGARP